MRRVVVTGMGIVSCLGNELATVSRALRESHSGIRSMPGHAELGLRSQVAGVPEIDRVVEIDRKLRRFMGDRVRICGPLWLHMEAGGLAWLAADGLADTLGVVFFVLDERLRHGHSIWHMFVLASTACHFLAVLFYAM